MRIPRCNHSQKKFFEFHFSDYLFRVFIFGIVCSGMESENMIDKDRPIAIYDSGVGGISVLKKVVCLLPHENYIYYGDSLNAPYGIKSAQEIKSLTLSAVEYLRQRRVKAIVIACNTATSAAIDDVREANPDLPVFGIEPALKPAVEAAPEGTIVVMATEFTLKEKKFEELVINVASNRTVVKMPCPGLVELVQNGKADSEETREYLRNCYRNLDISNISAVVLGCTHFPFAHKALLDVIGTGKVILDGAEGIARHLKDTLEERDLLTGRTAPGEIQILNSSPDKSLLDLSLKLLIQDEPASEPEQE